jgi:hypothetical protein
MSAARQRLRRSPRPRRAKEAATDRARCAGSRGCASRQSQIRAAAIPPEAIERFVISLLLRTIVPKTNGTLADKPSTFWQVSKRTGFRCWHALRVSWMFPSHAIDAVPRISHTGNVHRELKVENRAGRNGVGPRSPDADRMSSEVRMKSTAELAATFTVLHRLQDRRDLDRTYHELILRGSLLREP